VPHRALEQIWLERLRGGTPQPATDVIAQTALGRGVDLLTGSRDDIYALTHSLMYATDFGRAVPALPRASEVVIDELRSALAGALDDDDFDLAGELLLGWPMLGVPWSAPESFAFAVLARVEDEVGVLPSLAIDRSGVAMQPPEARRDYVTATTYHTAYVMGLLCAGILRRSTRPSRRPRGGARRHALMRPLRDELRSDGQPPQWQHDFEMLGDEEQGTLASWLRDIAVRRAVRRLISPVCATS
jgi:hypothetical protein